MDEIARERIYTMPFAGMKQIVRCSLTMLTKETFLYIDIRPQITDDPDFVLYEIWNKKKDFRLGDVQITQFSEQQTDVAFQIEPTIEGEERNFLTVFIEAFFAKVDDLHQGMGYLTSARGKAKRSVEIKDSGKYLHPYEKRRQIVQEYRAARRKGEVSNKDTWAQQNHQISGKTLGRYEDEFPEEA
jgi:hypothetical protein